MSLTIEEAMQALIKGKKIKEEVWSEGRYIYLNQSRNEIRDQVGDRTDFNINGDYDYFICEPIKQIRLTFECNGCVMNHCKFEHTTEYKKKYRLFRRAK